MNFLFGTLIALAATSGSARVSYVQQELKKIDVPKEYASQLFNDKRIKIYPANVVPRVKPEQVKYSANILTIESIGRGQKFLEDNRDILEKAEADYGVTKEEIVALIRVETNLGEYLGNLTVFNVFYTRLVTSPETKWKWDAANLVALGKYCYDSKIDCYTLKGSNAGAFGLNQFLPYSVQTWGIDGDGDGKINLFDTKDSIPSAANFLKEHGWEENKAVALAKYYGSGKTYPATVIGYADALRETAPDRGDENENTPPAPGKVSQFVTSALNKAYCWFSSIPYCED